MAWQNCYLTCIEMIADNMYLSIIINYLTKSLNMEFHKALYCKPIAVFSLY